MCLPLCLRAFCYFLHMNAGDARISTHTTLHPPKLDVLIVLSVSIEAGPQVRSSCVSCSAEFCCTALISLTLFLPKAERALKRERPLRQMCQKMPPQFTADRVEGGRSFFVPIKIIQIVRDLMPLSDESMALMNWVSFCQMKYRRLAPDCQLVSFKPLRAGWLFWPFGT